MGFIIFILVLLCLLYYRAGLSGQRDFGLVAAFLFAVLGVPIFSACQSTSIKTGMVAPTQPVLPSLTSTPEPTSTSIPNPSPTFTITPSPAPPAVPVVYYYFVAIESNTFPAGSVVILPDILILGPTLSEAARSPDPVTNIGAALQAMLNDPRNAWSSSSIGVTSLTFKDGAANVVLEGEYFAPGDVVLIAARAQILLTVFAEASVQTATIMLNGKNIANLGISHSSQAKPADFTYTRAEIETFMVENAYENPLAEQESQENLGTLTLEGIWQQNRSMAAGWADRYHFYPSGTYHYYPNEMICSKEKIEKVGTWKYENTILTLTTTRQIINRLEIYPGGLCHIIGKTEIELIKPGIEQFTIVNHGTRDGDIYPSISINDLQFWKFSADASSYGGEKFPEQ